MVEKQQPEMATPWRILSSVPDVGKGKWGLALTSLESPEQDLADISQVKTYFRR